RASGSAPPGRSAGPALGRADSRATAAADPAARQRCRPQAEHGGPCRGRRPFAQLVRAGLQEDDGKDPVALAARIPIGLVKQALQAEKVMIADISTQFGFADQAHLTRVFRQVTGTTPAAWLR